MAYVAIADRDHHLHDPQTFIEKYVWSQDHKVIAIQYGSVAIFVGLIALGIGIYEGGGTVSNTLVGPDVDERVVYALAVLKQGHDRLSP